MPQASTLSVLEDLEASSLHTLEALSRENIKNAKKRLKAHFAKEKSDRNKQWVDQLKKMPSIREEVIKNHDSILFENPNSVITQIARHLREELLINKNPA